MPVPIRSGPASGDDDPAPDPARVPEDPSGLDGLPPSDPRDLPPVPHDVPGDPGHVERRHGQGSGAPLDLGDDPDLLGSDAYDDTAAFPYGDGRGSTPDLGGDLPGEGPDEGERDGFEWMLGIAAVLVLLGLVALLLSSRAL